MKVIQDPAFQAKVQSATMHKIAQAYTDISHEYIIGGFGEIFQIGLSEVCTNNDEVNIKQAKLEELKKNASPGGIVRKVIQQVRQQERAQLINSKSMN